MTRLVTINQAQPDTTSSTSFLSTAFYLVSGAITRANTNKIEIYNNKDTACCADSRASENMFLDYHTFKRYHRLYNRYATLGDTTRMPIEVIGTAVYALNGCTILTRNFLHIPALRGPLYSLWKQHQRLGWGFYSSYKDGSYISIPGFILRVEDSYDNIVSYWLLRSSYQGTIHYIEPKSTSSTAMATPSDRTSKITPEPTPQSPHIIPSDEESISYQTSIPPSINIDCLPQPSTNIKPTDPIYETLHKNSAEPLSIRNINIFYRDTSNLPPIHPSSTPAPYENRKKFESLNIHRIFGCRKFRNQKFLTSATNASLVN